MAGTDELVVDPLVYTLAGANLNSYACTFQKIFSNQMGALIGTGSMGGNVGKSKEWATSYDDTVAEAMRLTQSLIEAMGNYASVLQTYGYTYALADYSKGSGRAEPAEPSPFPAAWVSCVVPPPSAGGPDSGLFDDIGFAVSALEDFGVSIPDGEPDKLQTAADAWAKFASADGAGNLPGLLDTVANGFESETAPGLEYIDDDIRAMKTAAQSVLDLYSKIAQSCRDHKSAVVKLREKLQGLLRDLAVDITIEIATGVVFGAVAGALTAGFGAAAVAAAKTAKILEKVRKYSVKVIDILGEVGFKILKALDEFPANCREELQRIKDLLAKAVAKFANPKQLGDLFSGRTPKASELEDFAKSQGWVRSQTENGPVKYTDSNGVVRITLKSGSGRAPGSASPHVEIRDGAGQRTDPDGNPVTRKSPGNHTPIDWDLQ
ncbi:hypothetical protein [Nocardia aurea]|uniref:hypothetical protein n=1 Tax=Nocardia aurea TaxID=2144174 RepID=UPI002D8CF6D5|nr:hypothetical protein [Planctomycetaceae bacterium]